MTDALISVAEAARLLGVHPQRVHRRIQEGSLAAQKVGHQWVIETSDVRRLAGHDRPGRPLSAKSAWDLLDVARGGDAARSLDPVSRSRARSRLRELLARTAGLGVDEISPALARSLRHRARRRVLTASRPDLDDLRGDARLHLSGISLPDSNLAAGAVVEAYVAEADADPLIEEYLLSPSRPDEANVVLHVVGAALAPRAIDLSAAVVAPLALAADLAEHDGAREKYEAIRALTALRDRLNPGSG